jgi:hypothetical protein
MTMNNLEVRESEEKWIVYHEGEQVSFPFNSKEYANGWLECYADLLEIHHERRMHRMYSALHRKWLFPNSLPT